MSNLLHLECRVHEPPLSSGEVGQRLSQVPTILEYIQHRNAITELMYIDGIELSSNVREAALFFSQHPNCPMWIVDEYDKTHLVDPMEVEELSKESRNATD